MEKFSLHGKSILITGASSGIGKSIALTLSQLGAKVILIGRNELKLQDSFEQLEGEGHQWIRCDLTQNEAINEMLALLPPLQGVVFCAGVIDYMPAKQINAEAMRQLMLINFESQILLYQALHLQKKLTKGSSLVFISSVSALASVPATLVYAASKAALTSSVRVLASELAKFKIRVNSISPGLVRTPMLEHENVTEESMKNNESKYPLGLGEPEDVAHAVAFLLSNEARWITGIDLIVDGGYMLHQ